MSTTLATPLPGLPVKSLKLPKIWVLYYRYGNIPLLYKFFTLEAANLEEAKIRARRHCEIMGYVFMFIRPFVVDLEYQEAKRLEGENIPDEHMKGSF